MLGPLSADNPGSLRTSAVAAVEAPETRSWCNGPLAWVRGQRVLLLWLVVGLIGRIFVVRSLWGFMDADEATGILMASRASHGQFFALFWGGNYGGTLVTWIEGPLVALFGLHVVLFEVVDTALTVVATLLLARVARRLVSPRAATAAAVLFWVGPPDWVRWSTHEYVWWVPGVCVALGVALCCLRWNEARGDDRRLWPIGLLAGVAFWLYPLLGSLVAPPVLAVAWALRRRPGALLKALALAPVGALPWLYTSVIHGFSTLERGQVPTEPVLHRLVRSITEVLPNSVLTSALVHPSTTVVAVIGVVMVGVTALFVVWHAHRRHWLLALAGTPVLMWPFVLAASGVTVNAGTYRYGFIVVPSLAVVLAYLVDQVRLSLVVPVAAAAVTVFGGAQVTGNWAATPAYAPGLDTVSSLLVAQHRTHVYAGYAEAYPLSVASDERVTATPTNDTVRFVPYKKLAERAPRTTYVFLAGGTLDQQMTLWSHDHHIGTRLQVAGFAVWEFSGPEPRHDIPLTGDL